MEKYRKQIDINDIIDVRVSVRQSLKNNSLYNNKEPTDSIQLNQLFPLAL